MEDITAIILTKDEELNILDCINSIKDIVKRIVVIDSFSSDKTVEIALSCGAEVFKNQFENHAKQFMFGIDVAKINTVWILRIDADERLTQESASELEVLCSENIKTEVNGIILRFKKNFLGKDLYHGGVYPWKKLSCYKAKYGAVEDKSMDEHIILSQGKTIEMKNDSLHLDFKNLEYFIRKHNWYSSKEAYDYFEFKEKNIDKNEVNYKTLIKTKIYYRLPLGVRAHLYFLFRYYIKLGFLDGTEGKLYAFFQAYWYRYLVDAKIYECEKMKYRYSGKGELK